MSYKNPYQTRPLIDHLVDSLDPVLEKSDPTLENDAYTSHIYARTKRFPNQINMWYIFISLFLKYLIMECLLILKFSDLYPLVYFYDRKNIVHFYDYQNDSN
jgi:hypothetical protein